MLCFVTSAMLHINAFSTLEVVVNVYHIDHLGIMLLVCYGSWRCISYIPRELEVKQ
jgi:hypothetical protein